MPHFNFDGEIIRRKNTYLACAMAERERTGTMTEAERAKMYKEAYWADYVTGSEWPVVLGLTDTATKSNRSRLKRKGAGWLVALAHIAELNPELFKAMCEQARTMHEKQMLRPYPWEEVVPPLAGLRRAEEGEAVQVRIKEPTTNEGGTQ